MRRVAPKPSFAALLVALCGGVSIALAQGQDHRVESHQAQQHRAENRGVNHAEARGHAQVNARAHDHAYPARGFVAHALPARHYDVAFHGAHYFFAGGVWYAPRGGLFVVVAPPFGVFVPLLPPFYTTIWVGGVPYYYADDVYYVYRGPVVGYEVVVPPPGVEAEAAPPPPGPELAPAPESHDLIIYPKNGQSPDQQARDQYECHTWASSQTGFDPTAPNGGVPPDETAGKHADYNRAMGACLEGRGYVVR